MGLKPSSHVTRLAARWEELEKKPQPNHHRGTIEMPFADFREIVMHAADAFTLIDRLYAGEVVVLRGAFTRGWIGRLRNRTHTWMSTRPPSFHKMMEGSPDFHRNITREDGKKYAFPCCKHAAYFYRWNGDPIGMMDAIYDRWRVVKILMGLDPLCYERNTPKDGVVDRVQVVRYPTGDGFLAPHADPWKHQRLFISTYMSKEGTDYSNGGFYFLGPNGEHQNFEDSVSPGDMCIGYATVRHGVDPCDQENERSGQEGRWFLSTYSNASDEVAERHTGVPVA